MIIKGKDKWITFNIYMMLLVSIVGFYIFISEYIINKDYKYYYLLFLAICIYFCIAVYYGFKTLNNISIKIEGKSLIIYQFEKTRFNIKKVFLYPYCSNRYGKMRIPTYHEINLNNIMEYGFVSELSKEFKNNVKFNIGFIDKDKNKCFIDLKQFKDEEVFELLKEVKHITKKEPVGRLKDVIR